MNNKRAIRLRILVCIALFFFSYPLVFPQHTNHTQSFGEKRRRGETIIPSSALYVEKIFSTLTKDHLKITVTFNQPINPNCISNNTFLINNKNLNTDTEIKYSRDGREIQLLVPKYSFTVQGENNIVFSFQIVDIFSLYGNKINSCKYPKLQCERAYCVNSEGVLLLTDHEDIDS